MGNIYVADGGNNRIVRITTAGAASVVAIKGLPSPTTLSRPFGVTVDPLGNLYIPDSLNSRILFVNVSGAALTYPTTGEGETSAAQTATVTNLGNELLIFSANPTYTTNFSNNSGDTNPCTASTSLTAGMVCDVSVNFTPQSVGNLSAGITVTNDTLNVDNSTEQVSVSGTGFLATPPALTSSSYSVTFSSQLVGTSGGTQTITLTNGFSSAEALGSIALSSTLDFTISSTTCGSTLAAHQTCTITFKVTPQATGSRTATLNVVHTDPSANTPTTLQITLSVAATQADTAGLTFIPVTPCRVADTRNAAGTFGGPSLVAATKRDFAIPASSCGIPATAKAYSLNVTAVPVEALGYLSVWPSGQNQPLVSTLNSDGRIKANAAIVPAGASGAVSVYASDASDVILDINGYFVTPSTAPSLAFYPLTPCRVADTRNATPPLGGPYLTGGTGRTFPVSTSNCNIPNTAEAYSLNFTAIPHTSIRYLTAFATGQGQSGVSTLNASSGTATANAAIVAAGTNGNIDVYSTEDADLVIDINGYFGPLSNTGMALYTATPCRMEDTRTSSALSGKLAVNTRTGTCSAPATATALVLNATVVPANRLGYLTVWPDGAANMPLVSTLNSWDGAVSSNMSIVQTTNGSVDLFTSDSTQVILDMSAYFGALNIFN